MYTHEVACSNYACLSALPSAEGGCYITLYEALLSVDAYPSTYLESHHDARYIIHFFNIGVHWG